MDLGIMNITLGMKGISNLASGSDMFSEAVDSQGFGDILAKAASDVSGEISTEDIQEMPEEEELSFGELAEELSAKIDEAGPEVISAAVQLLQSVGKAVEKFLGGELMASEEDDNGETESITDIFGVLLDLVPEKGTDNDMLCSLFGSVSEVIDAGFAQDMDTPDIVDQLLDVLKPKDEDDESLADAVMMLLCSLSGVKYQADDFDSALITGDAVSKLGSIADIISDSTDPADTVQNLSEILKGTQAEESEVEFIEFFHRQTGISFSDGIVKAANSLKVNDVSAQLTDIDPEAANVMMLAENVEQTADTEAVFKELGEIVNTQITERLVSELSTKQAFDVKELTVVLRPESLGEIAVKIAADENGVLSIVMAASNSEVGKAISENAAALSEGLARQNIRVEEVNVVNPSEASSYMGLDFTNQSFNRKNGDGNSSEGGSGRGRGSVEAIGSDMELADAARAQKLLKEAKLWATA